MFRRFALVVMVGLLVFVMVQPALAHPGHPGHGFDAGLAHPLFGLDHLLAMVAVGLLAARFGGRALWLVPAAFMGAMLVGGGLGASGVPLPFVEPAILASVLVLGLLVAARGALPLALATALVALFAIFHGHAHAAEMAADGSFASYAAGFLLGTGLLHATGIGSALVLQRYLDLAAVRACGAAISAASLLMFVGLM